MEASYAHPEPLGTECLSLHSTQLFTNVKLQKYLILKILHVLKVYFFLISTHQCIIVALYQNVDTLKAETGSSGSAVGAHKVLMTTLEVRWIGCGWMCIRTHITLVIRTLTEMSQKYDMCLSKVS